MINTETSTAVQLHMYYNHSENRPCIYYKSLPLPVPEFVAEFHLTPPSRLELDVGDIPVNINKLITLCCNLYTFSFCITLFKSCKFTLAFLSILVRHFTLMLIWLFFYTFNSIHYGSRFGMPIYFRCRSNTPYTCCHKKFEF
jgi:hypothetical protein